MAKMDITVFYENLACACAVANQDYLGHMYSQINGNKLEIKITSKTLGLINCINARLFTINPEPNKPHHMSIDEVWFGYDAEGYRWSDAMGGRLVDCTGLNIDKAIDLIVEKFKEMVHR